VENSAFRAEDWAIFLKPSAFPICLGTALGLCAAPLLTWATATASESTKATIERACQPCHDLSVLSQAPHSAADWHVIVARMRANGADVTEAEAKDIEAYLVKSYPTQP